LRLFIFLGKVAGRAFAVVVPAATLVGAPGTPEVEHPVVVDDGRVVGNVYYSVWNNSFRE